jgi:hypothetical protein
VVEKESFIFKSGTTNVELLHVRAAGLGSGNLIHANDLNSVGARLMASSHLTVFKYIRIRTNESEAGNAKIRVTSKVKRSRYEKEKKMLP